MLKNVLSLLLSKFYSKKENETISHLATPNIANTVNVMLTTTESSAIVAPFDGYLNIETTAEGNPTINIWEALWCNATPISPFQAKIFVPVTKGQRIQYRVTGTISQARFVRLVGGGYQTLKNALLQGGGLCLNSLSSSLRKSSCRVKKNGWLNNGMLIIQRKSSCLFQTLQGFRPILHQRMVCLSSRNLASERVISKLMRPVLGFTRTNTIQTLSFIRELLFRLIRDRQSVIRHTRRTERACLALLSSPSLANRNSAVGGASC